MTVPTLDKLAQADSAMETLYAVRRHAKGCPQCPIDTKFCNTYGTYMQTFEKEYENWLRLRAKT